MNTQARPLTLQSSIGFQRSAHAKGQAMFDNLFAPLTVNGMILKNRIVAAPTSDLFEEKATGGAGMVIAGHAIVEPGRSSYASPVEP